jgi:hypothetical protein
MRSTPSTGNWKTGKNRRERKERRENDFSAIFAFSPVFSS